MSLLVGILALGVLFSPHPSRREVSMDCPQTTPDNEVCVFTDQGNIVAINPTENPVKVVIQIQRIENVELVYRYPFIEVLPPHSSRTLISYKVVRDERPFALDYDWGWVTPTQ